MNLTPATQNLEELVALANDAAADAARYWPTTIYSVNRMMRSMGGPQTAESATLALVAHARLNVRSYNRHAYALILASVLHADATPIEEVLS